MSARPASAHLAVVEGDMGKAERRAGKVAVQRQKVRDRTRSAVQPCERDMRHKGARFGRDADAREQLVDLAMERREGFVRLDAGPDHMRPALPLKQADRSEEHTSELQSLMRISYAVFCLKKKNRQKTELTTPNTSTE